MTRSIQAQFDDINNEVDALNTELDSYIKSGPNTLTSDVTLNGGHMFYVATSEIGYLSGVSLNIQTQCDKAI